MLTLKKQICKTISKTFDNYVQPKGDWGTFCGLSVY